jgi:hypothetical protein
MKILENFICSASVDDCAKETREGGVFKEIKDYNINPDFLKNPLRVDCSGALATLDQTLSHISIWEKAEQGRFNAFFSKDEAMMLLNKAASFLDVENREIIVYLQEDRSQYLVAESFLRKKEEGLIKRILLCKIAPNYQHRFGTGIILK